MTIFDGGMTLCGRYKVLVVRDWRFSIDGVCLYGESRHQRFRGYPKPYYYAMMGGEVPSFGVLFWTLLACQEGSWTKRNVCAYIRYRAGGKVRKQ